MPTITLKGLPDALYERLKQQAETNRRSLNSEVLMCLERATAYQATDSASMLARIAHMQETLNVQPFTDLELNAAKNEGRT
ncbi:MAG: Arc family DNA-binding protein [Gemmatimonadaceae bacterium]